MSDPQRYVERLRALGAGLRGDSWRAKQSKYGGWFVEAGTDPLHRQPIAELTPACEKEARFIAHNDPATIRAHAAVIEAAGEFLVYAERFPQFKNTSQAENLRAALADLPTEKP